MKLCFRTPSCELGRAYRTRIFPERNTSTSFFDDNTPAFAFLPVRQLRHEAKALAGSSVNAAGGAPEAGDGEQAAAPDGAEGDKADNEKREMEKAMADAVAEQEALQAAAEDKKALGASMQRVAELEVRS